MKDRRRILVTGGAGFIGSHLVERLVGDGAAVTVLDDLSTGLLSNLSAVADEIHFIEASVTEGITGLDASFDEIHHLAATVGVMLVVDEPIRTIETNILETVSILEFGAASDASVLITSTSEVYGKSDELPYCEDADLVFGPTTHSRWCYGCSKAVDEHLAVAWHRERGVPVRIARLFNTIGPRQRGRWGMVVPRFVAAALAGEPLVVHGDGEQTRCFADVGDVVPMLLSMMANDECRGQVVNVGSDRPISINDLARLVVAVLGSRSTIEHHAVAEVYGEGFEDLRDRRPDLSKCRALLGCVPETPLEATIRSVAAGMSAGNQC
jgi:UDP-glucose 4-epimerase